MSKEYFTITVSTMFEAAHHLRTYRGDAEEPHIHDWHVELSMRAEELDDDGIAVDFVDVATTLESVLLPYRESKYLNIVPPLDEQNPSAENFARVIGYATRKILDTENAKVKSVTVWEDDGCRATWHIE